MVWARVVCFLLLFIFLYSFQLCCAFIHSLLIVRFYDVLLREMFFFALLLASLSDLFVFLIWPACWRWRGKMMSSTSLNSNPVDFRHRAWHYRLFSQVKFRDRKTTTKTQFQNKRNNLDISIRIHITHIHEVRHPQWIAGGMRPVVERTIGIKMTSLCSTSSAKMIQV